MQIVSCGAELARFRCAMTLHILPAGLPRLRRPSTVRWRRQACPSSSGHQPGAATQEAAGQASAGTRCRTPGCSRPQPQVHA